jgi:hypothetical protein
LCRRDQLPAGVRELGIETALIIGGRARGDVLERLETRHEARAPATTEQHGLRELRHAHALAGRVVEQDQHLGLRQREAVHSPHLDIQLVDDACVNLPKPSPSAEFK